MSGGRRGDGLCIGRMGVRIDDDDACYMDAVPVGTWG